MTPEELARRCRRELDDLPYGVISPRREDIICRYIKEALAADSRGRVIPGSSLTEWRLAEIAERERNATPGPWSGDDRTTDLDIVAHDPNDVASPWEIAEIVGSVGASKTLTPVQEAYANAAFIAASRQDIPALLTHVAYLESILRDAIGHGEVEHYLRGRIAGLEEAAEAVDGTKWADRIRERKLSP